MRRIQTIFIAILICIVSQVVHGESMVWDGKERTYETIIPSNLGGDSQGYPLVIGLHGVTPENQYQLTPGEVFIATAGLILNASLKKIYCGLPKRVKV